MVSLLAGDLHASVLEIGLIAASFSFIPLFLAYRAGKIIDRFHGNLPIVFGIFTVAVSLILPFLFHNLYILYVSQTLSGIAHLFVVIALQNSLGLFVPIKQRDHYFGWFSFWVSGGQLIGPLVGGIISESGIYNTFLVFSIISFAVTLLCLLLLRSKKMKDREQEKVKEKVDETKPQYTSIDLIKIPGMFKSISASMIVQFSKDVLITYFPLFAASRGASTTLIGALLSVQGVTAMLIRVLQGSILKLANRYTVLFISLLISGLCFAFIPFHNSYYYWTLLFLLLGAGMGLAQPLSTVAVVNLSPTGYSGRALSIRITGNRMAQSASPILFGVIAQLVGIGSIFFICGAIIFSGSFYIKTGEKDEA